jgi:hypothetical protein
VARRDGFPCRSQAKEGRRAGQGRLPNEVEERGQVRIVKRQLTKDEYPQAHRAGPHVGEVGGVDCVHVLRTHLRREKWKSSFGMARES